MNVVSRTHVGNVRPSNQDALLVLPGRYGLFGVADGMGGHKAGDVASRMAVDYLSGTLSGARPAEALLRGCIEQANLKIYREQLANEEGVTFIDMTQATKNLYESYGSYDKCYAALFDKGAETDNTHPRAGCHPICLSGS